MAAESDSDAALLADLEPLRVLRNYANLGIAVSNLARCETKPAASGPDPQPEVEWAVQQLEIAAEGQLAEQSAALTAMAELRPTEALVPPALAPFVPPIAGSPQPYVPERSRGLAMRLLRWLVRPLRRLVYGSLAGRMVFELDHNADVRTAGQTAKLEHRLEELTRRQFEPIWQELQQQAAGSQRRSDLLLDAMQRQHDLISHLFSVIGELGSRQDTAVAIASENTGHLRARLTHLEDLLVALSQRQIASLEQTAALIIGGQADQLARLDGTSRAVVAAAKDLDQALADHHGRLAGALVDQVAGLGKESRALVAAVQSAGRTLRQELDERADRRASETMAAARQLLELLSGVRASLDEGRKLTLHEIDHLGRQQEALQSSVVQALLGQIANEIQHSRNSLDQTIGNRLLDLRGSVNDDFGRLAGQINAADTVRAQLLLATQEAIETSSLAQQQALSALGQEIDEKLGIESRSFEAALRPLLARLESSFEHADTQWLGFQTTQQQAAELLTEAVDLAKREGAERSTLLRDIISRLDLLATASAEPVSAIPSEQLARIELYSLAAARRFALPVGEGRILIRTEVGYMVCPADDTPLLAQLVDQGELEPGTRILIEKLLTPGDVFLDVGANIGMHTIAAARRVGPEGSVFAIEPFPASLGALLESSAINGLRERIHPTQAAAWCEMGEAALHLGATSGHHSLVELDGVPRGELGSIAVKTVRIDSIIPKAQAITLAKIDVEGAELEALQGARNIFDRCPDAGLIIEYGKSHLDARGIRTTAWFSAIQTMGFDQCYMIEPRSGALSPTTAAGCMTVKEVNLLFLRSGSRLWERIA